MNKLLYPLHVLGLVICCIGCTHRFERVVQTQEQSSPNGRAEYEHLRLVDPATGEIPANIRMKELAFASTLPRTGSARSQLLEMDFVQIGPYNVGGRTRAFAIDKGNPDNYLAGGVSGGMWKSTNAGASWSRVTAAEDHAAVSCVSQDPRSGKTNIWYYGSGEVVGNSASKSFSAYYRGSGIYKSTDRGDSWSLLPSTAALVQKASEWDAVFRVLVDPSRNDSDIVLAAMSEGIMRSNDGGTTWKPSLKLSSSAGFTDLAVNIAGVFYAAISSDANGTSKGLWRSTDGLNWTRITPNAFPSNHDRTLISIYPGDENKVYFFSSTPGAGTIGNSLWKYHYLAGDGTGSGAIWSNRSSGLPHSDLNLYNGYCQVLGVKPDDEDVVFVGGTNLYRSSNGFQDTLSTHHIGGYKIEWDTNFTYRSGIHYPDQQSLFFHPQNADIMISTTDGGIHRTEHCADSGFVWQSLSNGYVVSQFYGISIDHATVGSEEIMGGLQDRGTFWTNSSDPNQPWVSVRGADGAYCWIEDGGNHHYSSTQYAGVRRASIDSQGNLAEWFKVMPEDMPTGGGSGLLFVHPFTLDPLDNEIMYLPYLGQVWRNDDLPAAENEDLTAWRKISDVTGTITAIAASESEQGVVYVGTSQQRIYRIDDANTISYQEGELISTGITTGGYTSCIAIDPYDADRIIVVYSNYNTVSLWLTEDAGANWEPIEGNLRGTPDPNVPPSLYYIGDGPSTRWMEIAMTDEGYVYLLGTSVGLFSTRELNGDSTIWTMEGTETIGNVVVDMLEYREDDQWVVAGTHGNGIYTANIQFTVDTTDTIQGFAEDQSNGFEFELYPNPTNSGRVHVMSKGSKFESTTITLFDQYGRLLKSSEVASREFDLDVSGFSAGVYYVKVQSGADWSIKRFVKN